MSELMRNPRVLQKAQAGVREAFRGRRKLTEDDIGRLSYLHLVIREALRLHVPVPFLLPRHEAPIRQDGYGDTSTAIRDTAISKNSDSAIRRVYV
jgi:cytochrome P450